MQRNNTEDKPQRQNKHNDGIDFQTWRLIRIQPYTSTISLLFPKHHDTSISQPSATRNERLAKPHPSRSDKMYILSMVLVLPPAPAALVLEGLALATLSALSAAAFLRMAVLGPPGGEEGRAVLEPAFWGELVGELERGDD